jgi:uncharacterized protein YbjQ (UPF0145 family)
MIICPACGCEQREAAKCFQCDTPLQSNAEVEAEKRKIEQGTAISRPDPFLVETKKEKSEKRDKEGVERSFTKSARQESQVRTVEPGRRTVAEEGAQKVLITTTQKIEGRKITTYFGMITANIIIELDDQLSSIPDKKVFSTNANYRSHLKSGMLIALRDLRGEAALLGANAVIATTFNFQRMDPRSLLLSAIGTAVFVESKS